MLNYQRVNDLQSGFLVWTLLVTCPACDFATVRCGDCAFQIKLAWRTSCLLEIWSPVSIWSAKTPKSFAGWGWPVTIYCIAMFVDCHVCWPIVWLRWFAAVALLNARNDCRLERERAVHAEDNVMQSTGHDSTQGHSNSHQTSWL
jgi:hypothetical protein